MVLSDDHKVPLSHKIPEFDSKNTTVAQIFKLLNQQMSTEIDLRNHQIASKPENEQEEVRLSPHEQMQAMMKEVADEFTQRFDVSMKEIR